MWATRFKVQGRSNFPLDMLRYDACYPASNSNPDAVSEIGLSLDIHYKMLYEQEHKVDRIFEVELVRQGSCKEGCKPTVGRWESFGWTVVAQHSEKW